MVPMSSMCTEQVRLSKPATSQLPKVLLFASRTVVSADEPNESPAYLRLNIPQLARLGLFSRLTQGCCSESVSTHNIQFAFGHGGDQPGYVHLTLKSFYFPSTLLVDASLAGAVFTRCVTITPTAST